METEMQRLALHIITKTKLACEVTQGVTEGGACWYLLRPSGHSGTDAFGIRTTLRWRSVVVVFEPDRFAGDLLSSMGAADSIGRSAFLAILRECESQGASIEFRVNDEHCGISKVSDWTDDWNRVSISLRKLLEPEDGEDRPDFAAVMTWTGKFTAAILALLPVQDEGHEQFPGASGFEEGAESIQRITRYERDRRNRAAAIAIWGTNCQACGFDFGARYGPDAAGFIEIHHLTPISTLERSMVVDPARDLVPLCSNCHAVAHRRTPPFSVKELQQMLRPGS